MKARLVGSLKPAAKAALYFTGFCAAAALIGDRSWWSWSTLVVALGAVYGFAFLIAYLGALAGIKGR